MIHTTDVECFALLTMTSGKRISWNIAAFSRNPVVIAGAHKNFEVLFYSRKSSPRNDADLLFLQNLSRCQRTRVLGSTNEERLISVLSTSHRLLWNVQAIKRNPKRNFLSANC